MVKIRIEVLKKKNAEKAKNMFRTYGCKIKEIKLTENASEPITIEAVCYDDAIIDKILENLDDPDFKTRVLPDELSPQPKWKIPKTRKMDL